MKTLALVVRVSDVKGRDKKGDRFISPDEQVRKATAYAKQSGYQVQVIEPMDLNVSHKVPLNDRPAMGEALRLVEAGKLAGIVVSSADRLGPLMLTRELKDRLLAAGGVLKVQDNPSAEVLDARGFAKLPSEYMDLMHEAQREEIGLRWDGARAAAIRSGAYISRVVPTGYDRGDDRKLVPNEHSGAVKRVFELRRDGASWSECCRLLEDAGVPKPRHPNDEERSPHWTHSAVMKMVANPAYKGWARHGKHVNESAHPVIVEPALWDAVQTGKRPRTRTNDGALLASVIHCASCGRRLIPGITENRYRCRPRVIAGPPCEAPASVNMAEAEDLVQAAFMLNQATWLAEADAPNLEPLERAVTKARADYQKWTGLGLDAIDPATFAERAAALKAEVDSAEAALYEAKTEAGRNAEAQHLGAQWESLTVPERRRWLRAFGVTVTVERGREPTHKRLRVVTERLHAPELP